MTKERVRFWTNGMGYEEVRVCEIDDCGRRTNRSSVKHHRILAWLWGDCDSPFFDKDFREVHHKTNVEWLNIEDNLITLTPEQHRYVDDGRAKIVTSWDTEDRAYLNDEIRRRCEPIHE